MARKTLRRAYQFSRSTPPDSNGEYTEIFDQTDYFFDTADQVDGYEVTPDAYYRGINGGGQAPPDPYPVDQDFFAIDEEVFGYCMTNEPGETHNRRRVYSYAGNGATSMVTLGNSPVCGVGCDLVAEVSTRPTSAEGQQDGEATVEAASSSLPATATLYNLDGSIRLSLATPATFSGLGAGSYVVEVADSAGCVERTTAEVGETLACNLLVEVEARGDTAFARNLGNWPVEYRWPGELDFSERTFATLPAVGPYAVEVREKRNPAGCLGSFDFSITQGGRGICYRYALLIRGKWFPILEPLKFDGLTRQLKRDPKLHGMAATFNAAVLQFTCDQGGDLLQAEYNTLGANAEAELVEMIRDHEAPGGWRIPYTGAVVFAVGWEVKAGSVYANVEASGLPVLLASRYKTKSDLYALKTVDGEPMPPLSKTYANLHSKSIVKVGEARAPQGSVGVLPFQRGQGARDPTIVLGFSNITTNDLTKFNAQTTGVSLDKNVYEVFEAEEIIVGATLEFAVDMRLKIALNSGDFDEVKFELFYKRGNLPEERLLYIQDQHVDGDYNSDNYVNEEAPHGHGIHVSRKFTGVDFAVGDKVYIWAKVQVNDVSGSYFWTYDVELFDTSFVRISGDTQVLTTTAAVVPIHEGMERVLHAVTGKADLLRSELFGRENSRPRAYPVTGCGGLNVLAQGFQVRGLADKPYPLALQDLIDGLNPLFCIGMGIREENGAEVVRVEGAASFYDDYEAIRCATPSPVAIKGASDFLYNRIRLGFDKWQPEGRVENGLDEPNAVRQWNTPLRKIEAEYVQLSKFVGGSYLIEAQRRLGATTEDGKNDNSTFIIGCKPAVLTAQRVSFLVSGAGTPYAQNAVVGQIGPYSPGDTLTITGGNNAGTYTVTAFTPASFSVLGGFTLAVATVAETFPDPDGPDPAFVQQAGFFESERDEAFDVLANVYSPETIYNPRLSPARLFYRHWPLIGASLWPQPVPGAVYRVAAAEGNLNFASQLKAGDSCPLGVPEGLLVREKDDIAAENVGGGTYGLFKPNRLVYTHDMSDEAFEALVKRRYGWASVQVADGDWRTGWILSCVYTQGKGEATFELIERNGPAFDPATSESSFEFNTPEFNTAHEFN